MAKVDRIDQLYTFARTGTVMGNATWSETHFSATTSGGGANAAGYAGSVSTQVSSSTTEKSRFFIREADGDEVEINLSDADFGVRDGHLVTIAYAGDTTSKRGWPLGLYNHNTRKREILAKNFRWVRGALSPGAGFGLLIVGAFPGLLLMAFGDIGGLVSIIGFGAVLTLIIRKSIRRDLIDAEIRRQLDALIDTAIAEVKAGKEAERRIEEQPTGAAA